MRCSDAKLWLAAQREHEKAQSADAADGDNQDLLAVKEHIDHCPDCHSVQQRLITVDSLLHTTPRAQPNVSTEQIMLAIQEYKRTDEQIEHLRAQQRSRVAKIRPTAVTLAALTVLIVSSIPLFVIALTIIQPDLFVKSLNLVGDSPGILVVLAQYLQAGLTMVTRNNWLLSAVAFAVVIMMGIWLRLMRHPQEV